LLLLVVLPLQLLWHAASASDTAAAAPTPIAVSPEAQQGLNYIEYQLYSTWDPENETASWQEWFQTTHRDGNAALRYTVAHLGYTAAIACAVADAALERCVAGGTCECAHTDGGTYVYVYACCGGTCMDYVLRILSQASGGNSTSGLVVVVVACLLAARPDNSSRNGAADGVPGGGLTAAAALRLREQSIR
jgi:hypothetical protein